MLVKHRIHNADKGLIAREQTVAPREQIAFKPTLAKVFAEHFHDAAMPREMDVVGLDLLHPYAIGCLEDVVQTIGGGLVRSHQTEIATFRIQANDVAQI